MSEKRWLAGHLRRLNLSPLHVLKLYLFPNTSIHSFKIFLEMLVGWYILILSMNSVNFPNNIQKENEQLAFCQLWCIITVVCNLLLMHALMQLYKRSHITYQGVTIIWLKPSCKPYDDLLHRPLPPSSCLISLSRVWWGGRVNYNLTHGATGRCAALRCWPVLFACSCATCPGGEEIS